jgi:hypothetical protein
MVGSPGRPEKIKKSACPWFSKLFNHLRGEVERR